MSAHDQREIQEGADPGLRPTDVGHRVDGVHGRGGDVQPAPWRQTHFAGGQELVLLGANDQVARFAADYGIELDPETPEWFESFMGTGGFAELVVLPRAPLAGQCLRDFGLRKTYMVEPIVLLTGAERQPADFSDMPLSVGDVIVVHGSWEHLRKIAQDRSFAVLTPIEGEETDPSKGVTAALCFAGAVGLAIAGFPLSISLFSGAVMMVLLRVLPIDDAYRAVDWRTVFLLAGLIPLGTAMDKSGAAAYVANGLTSLLAGSPIVVLMLAVGLLATLFSLFMSNVAATVLLAPLAMIVGAEAGIDGRALALLVAVCASNSFVLPTHQVNALFMSPGGYRNADYIRAGGIMTVLFLAIAVGLGLGANQTLPTALAFLFVLLVIVAVGMVDTVSEAQCTPCHNDKSPTYKEMIDRLFWWYAQQDFPTNRFEIFQ